jgi:hypothetical protein
MPVSGSADNDAGVAARLAQLAALHSSGDLSDEEYEAAKRQTIGLSNGTASVPTLRSGGLRKRWVAVAIAVLVLGGAAAAGATLMTGNPKKSSSGSTFAANAPQELFNLDSASTRKLCADYDGLVNAGWTDTSIYTDLNDRGAFNSYGVPTHQVFVALVRWCSRHGA